MIESEARAATSSPVEEFEVFKETRQRGIVRRLFSIYRQFLGLVFGGLAAYLRELPKKRRRGLRYWLLRLVWLPTRPFVNRDLVKQPFPVQLRRRLEALGPTYIKLGQIKQPSGVSSVEGPD